MLQTIRLITKFKSLPNLPAIYGNIYMVLEYMYIHKLMIDVNANLSHARTSVGCGLLHTVANPCPQLAVTVTVLSVILSLVLTLSLST